MDYTNIIKEKIPLSSIISRTVKLIKRGNNFTGLCPFHSEKTPSFTVNDDTKRYYCFGCGARGDIFQFIIDNERVTFREALEYLAKIAGIELSSYKKKDNYSDYYKLLSAATKWFQSELQKSSMAIQYLRMRKISDAIIAKFQIGYSPTKGLVEYLLSNNYDINLMRSLGLLNNNKSCFYNRIIFPICNFSGKIVGFGARSLSNQQHPKYLNSNENILFKKRDILYGYHLAINEARKRGRVIVVEGYIDVLMLHQRGIQNVVGLLGTAMTHDDFQNLWKIVPEVILCMDGDNPGCKASIKSAKIALSLVDYSNVVKFIKLPDGQDPCDVCDNCTDEQLLAILNNCFNLSDFILDYEFSQFNIDSFLPIRPEQCYQLKNKFLEYVKLINNPQIAQYYKRFFDDQIYNLQKSYNIKSIKEVTKIHYDEVRELKNVSSNHIQQEYEEFIVVYCILKFPELLDNYQFFDLFTTFNIEIDSNIRKLQQYIIHIKTHYAYNLTNEVLLSELRKNNCQSIVEYIYQNKKVKLVDAMNQDINFVKKSLEKIILIQQLKCIRKEINDLKLEGKAHIAEKLSDYERNICDEINKLWK